jgi:hypothetical protein
VDRIITLAVTMLLAFAIGAAGAWFYANRPEVEFRLPIPVLHPKVRIPGGPVYEANARAARLQARLDALQAQAKTLAPRQAEVTRAADVKAKATDQAIQVRYRTLVEKVYVPADPAADPVVPAEHVRLLDEAASPVSITTGQSYDLATPLRLSELVRGYVTNLGIGSQNAEQLSGLQGWIRDQEALAPP